jgi:eukaryotic-like serine/threonine-protein kinase
MAEVLTQSLPLIQERYRVEALLGHTRLAAVYRATDERLQRNVLIHLFRKDLVGNESLRQRFLDECRASARRSHSALLEVFDSGEIGDRPYMVTEYAVGRPLREVGALVPDDALLYARQVIGAVALCQDQGLPHPPVSSANVLLTDPGRVKLIENWTLSPEEQARDLAQYRAPERARGIPPSPQGVVYALGVLLWEMVVGVRPFPPAGSAQASDAPGQQGLPPLATRRPSLVVPSLQRLLDQATAPDPAQRLPSTAAFAQALDATRSQLLGPTQRLAPPSTTPLGQRVRQVAATLVPPPKPAPTATTASPTSGSATVSRPVLRRNWHQIALIWLLLLALIAGVVVGGWWLADTITRGLQGAEAPRVTLPRLPSLDWRAEVHRRLPPWLREVLPAPATVLVVNAAGLNIRPEPGTNNVPLGELLSGTRVTLLEGPRILEDGSQWVRVRATLNDQAIEGWVNLEFLKPE